MRRASAVIRWIIVSLAAVLFILSRAGLAEEGSITRISPVSFSANAPGLQISPQLFERLLVRTELMSSELKELGLNVNRQLQPEDVARLLEPEEDRFLRENYVNFIDGVMNDSQQDNKFWKDVGTYVDLFDAAVNLGGFGEEDTRTLQKALMVIQTAKVQGDDFIQARMQAHLLFRQARDEAVRKSRGRRQLVDVLDFELRAREFERNIVLVVDVMTTSQRSTISPLSRVAMQCYQMDEFDLGVFHERNRRCDEFGSCRIESVAAVAGDSEFEKLFQGLQDDGRRLLDECFIITRMLIDGMEVTTKLPGKFTSHIAMTQSR